MRVLVTGTAGFIGFHVALRLLARGDSVVGFDNVNNYYDLALKRLRLAEIDRFGAENGSSYTFVEADLADTAAVSKVFRTHEFDRVIHLAAQAGVRHSLRDPRSYVDSNIVGFVNVLEACRGAATPHLTYASSSSVYGTNTRMPFSEHDIADHPLQLYAATKRANELMAHSYSHLFALPTTGLRFFTVYGPYGRPDMAPMIFAEKIMAGEPIPLFNQGRHSRDFTFIEDIVEGIVRASDAIAAPDPTFDPATPDPSISSAPFRVLNIGNGQPVELKHFVRTLENCLGRSALIEYKPMQTGDVADTLADVSEIERQLGYRPMTPIEDGVARFAEWFLPWYSASRH